MGAAMGAAASAPTNPGVGPAPVLRIPARVVRAIARRRPSTHEIGGLLRFHADGTHRDTRFVDGGVCRQHDGEHIVQCSVRVPAGPVQFHTHPKANRPSSVDLRNALVHDVAHGGSRQTNLLFSPTGVWVFRPTADLVHRFHASPFVQQRHVVRVWKFLGHYFQDDLQNGHVDEFRRHLGGHGFVTHFYPYAVFASPGAPDLTVDVSTVST